MVYSRVPPIPSGCSSTWCWRTSPRPCRSQNLPPLRHSHPCPPASSRSGPDNVSIGNAKAILMFRRSLQENNKTTHENTCNFHCENCELFRFSVTCQMHRFSQELQDQVAEMMEELPCAMFAKGPAWNRNAWQLQTKRKQKENKTKKADWRSRRSNHIAYRDDACCTCCMLHSHTCLLYNPCNIKCFYKMLQDVLSHLKMFSVYIFSAKLLLIQPHHSTKLQPGLVHQSWCALESLHCVWW